MIASLLKANIIICDYTTSSIQYLVWNQRKYTEALASIRMGPLFSLFILKLSSLIRLELFRLAFVLFYTELYNFL